MSLQANPASDAWYRSVEKTTLVHQRMGSDHSVLTRVSCLPGLRSRQPLIGLPSAGRAATKTGCGRALEAPPRPRHGCPAHTCR